MKKKTDQAGQVQNSTKAYELALWEKDDGCYLLRLFVSGMTPNSRIAIENVKNICEEHLKGRYDLEIIDIYQQPILAKEAQIVAVPTLVKEVPPPLRRFIGDMSQTERILAGLGLKLKK